MHDTLSPSLHFSQLLSAWDGGRDKAHCESLPLASFIIANVSGILFVSKEQFEDQARQILRVAGDVRGKLAERGVKLPV